MQMNEFLSGYEIEETCSDLATTADLPRTDCCGSGLNHGHLWRHRLLAKVLINETGDWNRSLPRWTYLFHMLQWNNVTCSLGAFDKVTMHHQGAFDNFMQHQHCKYRTFHVLEMLLRQWFLHYLISFRQMKGSFVPLRGGENEMSQIPLKSRELS